MMYLYINEQKIEPYNGENLKRFIGNRLVKVICNPTDKDLLEFGYKYLQEDKYPEEIEGYRIESYYEDEAIITKKYHYVAIDEESIEEETEE